MKQIRMENYRPNYPKKFVKGAALTAAAMLTLGSSLGCIARFETTTSGAVAVDEPTPEPTETLVLDGEVAIDDPTPESTFELTTEGIVPMATPDPGEEPVWMGDVVADPTEP